MGYMGYNCYQSVPDRSGEATLEQFIGTLVGAFLAVLVGFFVAVYHDIATEPVLEVVPNDEPPVTDRRLLEEMTDGDPLRPTGRLVRSPYRHQFLEIKVRQKNGLWPFPTRRPAWRCRVTFDVFRHDGSRAIAERITARWSGSLQPYRTQLVDGRLKPIPDDSLVPLGQTFDVHANAEEKVGVGSSMRVLMNVGYLAMRVISSAELGKNRNGN